MGCLVIIYHLIQKKSIYFIFEKLNTLLCVCTELFFLGDYFFFINYRIPDDPRVLPTIGNGHIATVVKTETLCMNGLYNGYAIKTHRALLPAILVRNVSVDGNVTSKYSLDVKNGT